MRLESETTRIVAMPSTIHASSGLSMPHTPARHSSLGFDGRLQRAAAAANLLDRLWSPRVHLIFIFVAVRDNFDRGVRGDANASTMGTEKV